MITESKTLIAIIALSLILGALGGNIIKRCPECKECVTNDLNTFRSEVYKAIEIEKTEIKKETENEIKKIILTNDVSRNDSIWQEYFTKYGFNHNP